MPALDQVKSDFRATGSKHYSSRIMHLRELTHKLRYAPTELMKAGGLTKIADQRMIQLLILKSEAILETQLVGTIKEEQAIWKKVQFATDVEYYEPT